MNIEFSVAGRDDELAIRRLLADNPMPGTVAVAFEREPDYFIGHGVMGDHCLTIRAVDTETGSLAGILCIAASDRWVAGRVTRVGYIGQARVDTRYRGIFLPVRAAAWVRALVTAEEWPELWFAAIVDDNPEASAIFAARPRPSFPALTPVSEIHTLGIATRALRVNPRPRARTRTRARSRPRGAISDVPETRVRTGGEVGLDAVARFLNEAGRTREFFPRYTEADLAGNAGPACPAGPARGGPTPDHAPARLPGLTADDILVAERDGRIVGACGAWDQSSFKQTVVHGYAGWLRRFRPFYNAFAPAFGAKRLPAVGEVISSAYLLFPVARDDDAEVFDSLLRAAIATAHAKGADYLLAGLSTRDPLLATARRFRHILYRSTMYAFTFDGPDAKTLFDAARVPYLEIAAL